MRPSKNIHLLARLRQQLGAAVSQDVVAEKLGVHPTTIRRIEIGKRKLTRALAERIGDTFDVDPECLMKNDLETGLRTRDGRAWTAKTRREIQNRLARWGELEPYARQAQRGISAALLHQYLRISYLIRSLPEPEDRLVDWVQLFDLAMWALIHSQGPITQEWKARDFIPKAGLETVFDDLQAIWADQRSLRRIEKRQAKQQNKSNGDLGLKRTYAELLGWNRRGLVATQLIDEIGAAEVEKMTYGEFVKLVRERCLKEGISWPKPFDPFQAIVAWNEFFEEKIQKARR